jgi:hypothetical protein
MGQLRLVVEAPKALTPLAFPIWASRVETQVSTENWSDRIKRMALVLDGAADGEADDAQAAAEAAVPDEEWSTAQGMEEATLRRQEGRKRAAARRGAGRRNR